MYIYMKHFQVLLNCKRQNKSLKSWNTKFNQRNCVCSK